MSPRRRPTWAVFITALLIGVAAAIPNTPARAAQLVGSFSTPKDAQIIIVQCNGRDSQKWQIIGGQIIGLGHKCRDIQDGSGADGTGLILSTCKPSPSQR
jgi:hypothetical protein